MKTVPQAHEEGGWISIFIAVMSGLIGLAVVGMLHIGKMHLTQDSLHNAADALALAAPSLVREQGISSGTVDLEPIKDPLVKGNTAVPAEYVKATADVEQDGDHTKVRATVNADVPTAFGHTQLKATSMAQFTQKEIEIKWPVVALTALANDLVGPAWHQKMVGPPPFAGTVWAQVSTGMYHMLDKDIIDLDRRLTALGRAIRDLQNLNLPVPVAFSTYSIHGFNNIGLIIKDADKREGSFGTFPPAKGPEAKKAIQQVLSDALKIVDAYNYFSNVRQELASAIIELQDTLLRQAFSALPDESPHSLVLTARVLKRGFRFTTRNAAAQIRWGYLEKQPRSLVQAIGRQFKNEAGELFGSQTEQPDTRGTYPTAIFLNEIWVRDEHADDFGLPPDGETVAGAEVSAGNDRAYHRGLPEDPDTIRRLLVSEICTLNVDAVPQTRNGQPVYLTVSHENAADTGEQTLTPTDDLTKGSGMQYRLWQDKQNKYHVSFSPEACEYLGQNPDSRLFLRLDDDKLVADEQEIERLTTPPPTEDQPAVPTPPPQEPTPQAAGS